MLYRMPQQMVDRAGEVCLWPSGRHIWFSPGSCCCVLLTALAPHTSNSLEAGALTRHPKFAALRSLLLEHSSRTDFHGIVFARTREAVRSLTRLLAACPDLRWLEASAWGRRGGGLGAARCSRLRAAPCQERRMLCPLCPLGSPSALPFPVVNTSLTLQGQRVCAPAPLRPAGVPLHGPRQPPRSRRRHELQGAAGGDGPLPPAGRAPAGVHRRGGGGHGCAALRAGCAILSYADRWG
jgi:hypothetical protein